ncbi:hypothetical protein BofuT4_P050670.1 [Botrytis cinerea T4]|uniref:Uncharacterized protein n=1 Tax=Botryotinia fuckeliana (strain T4) TaxID=999810 RepID=G2XXU0_BOTF4|nr:hypothetical protein BofuT4_P050670.1 [Botrytis cinerea T4]
MSVRHFSSNPGELQGSSPTRTRFGLWHEVQEFSTGKSKYPDEMSQASAWPGVPPLILMKLM